MQVISANSPIFLLILTAQNLSYLEFVLRILSTRGKVFFLFSSSLAFIYSSENKSLIPFIIIQR